MLRLLAFAALKLRNQNDAQLRRLTATAGLGALVEMTVSATGDGARERLHSTANNEPACYKRRYWEPTATLLGSCLRCRPARVGGFC